MCKADDQLLDEGHMIPSSNMWLNSSRAMRRRSGARRRVRVDTGEPVVSMWWTKSCLIGRSERREMKGLEESRCI